ncbi:porin family protein [Winogradskyella thalassocola]|uniref:Outer membrane protein beta-barrel domain-containing protein n=1 Tax=Winogradskyella thalassocola TaxID=262004 RepID=A0A1G7VPG2_9FLAO|nr:porin family protein [Winogradskyella thalassocola]SDG61702.1 Outer membrane protein beta-barrel domain-containing protein [Winogradskyella thalassocola]
MKSYLLLLVTLVGFLGFSQSYNSDTSELDEKYREDQFYASVTYNLLNEKPKGISQTGFSSGFHFGFIRDMPINQKRNVAIGLGMGISTNSYNQKNVLIEDIDNTIYFTKIDEGEYNVSKNKFTTYLVEVPLEIRWRTSNQQDYNFWRIYTGFKMGYVFYNSSKFKSEVTNEKLSNIDSFNKLQYGLTLSAGYSTWNFHVYYGLNSIFDNSATFDGASIDMKSLKIGLMFYIL